MPQDPSWQAQPADSARTGWLSKPLETAVAFKDETSTNQLVLSGQQNPAWVESRSCLRPAPIRNVLVTTPKYKSVVIWYGGRDNLAIASRYELLRVSLSKPCR